MRDHGLIRCTVQISEHKTEKRKGKGKEPTHPSKPKLDYWLVVGAGDGACNPLGGRAGTLKINESSEGKHLVIQTALPIHKVQFLSYNCLSLYTI